MGKLKIFVDLYYENIPEFCSLCSFTGYVAYKCQKNAIMLVEKPRDT